MSLLLRVILEHNGKLKNSEIREKVLHKFQAYSDIPSLRIDKYPTKTFTNDLSALRDAWKIKFSIDNHYRYSVKTDFDGIFQNDLLNSAIFLSSLNSDMMLPGYVIPETRKNTGLEHFHIISEAVQSQNKIKISYFDYITEDEKIKEICPYKIKQKDFKWYVLATDDSDVPFKSYALERIKNIGVSGKFRPQEIDFEEPYKDAIGMFTDSEAEEIIVEYDHRDGHYLKVNPIHHSQSVVSETADRIQFHFFVKPNNDLLMELLKRSWSLKVIKPEILKERMMGFWREAMERNKA
ncbi:helix-turn-helix transcriptional regulator [Chryseobacterium oryzae]|uniref:WYL domain-containing protein n=1 Tax=Chryseobacterium oryzae TaxID=2929799 RepID=A0ABY4BKI8_9FLAO|nr:WYL domain-containing protein [Chryseobacterium oryzae]UOE39697.1 WYL domain-containing protein [Chryseobacterium oryzae]